MAATPSFTTDPHRQPRRCHRWQCQADDPSNRVDLGKDCCESAGRIHKRKVCQRSSSCCCAQQLASSLVGHVDRTSPTSILNDPRYGPFRSAFWQKRNAISRQIFRCRALSRSYGAGLDRQLIRVPQPPQHTGSSLPDKQDPQELG